MFTEQINSVTLFVEDEIKVFVAKDGKREDMFFSPVAVVLCSMNARTKKTWTMRARKKRKGWYAIFICFELFESRGEYQMFSMKLSLYILFFFCVL